MSPCRLKPFSTADMLLKYNFCIIFMPFCKTLLGPILMQVSLGRETKEVHVDIDLSKEGKANKISRRQVLACLFYELIGAKQPWFVGSINAITVRRFLLCFSGEFSLCVNKLGLLRISFLFSCLSMQHDPFLTISLLLYLLLHCLFY